MDEKQFQIPSRKLDAIIALLAIDNLGDKSKSDNILLLSQYGLDNSTIASIVGSTPGTVAVRISEAKKTKGNKSGEQMP